MSSLRRNINFLQVLLTSVVLGLLIGSIYDVWSISKRWGLSEDPIEARLRRLELENAGLIKANDALRKQVAALEKAPASNENPQAQLNVLATSIQSLDKRFSEIERAILQDPAKALQLPILRKDLEKTQELTVAQTAALRQDIERTYSLITGTMIALALAVLAPALSNLSRRGQVPIDQDNKEAPNPAARADG